MRKLSIASSSIFALVVLGACSSSTKAPQPVISTAPAKTGSTASTSAPNQGFNDPGALSVALKAQWAKETADPTHAHYREGATVTNVVCAPVSRAHVSACVVSFSKGDPVRQSYLVTEDGKSFEGVESGG